MSERAVLDTNCMSVIMAMKLDDAKTWCLEQVKPLSLKAEKRAKLLRDIKEYTSLKKLALTMYNLVLAGEGLSTIGSPWQKQYGSSVKPKADT